MESCNSFKKYKLNLHIVQEGCVHYNITCREVYNYAKQHSSWLKEYQMDKKHKGSHGNANAETGLSEAGWRSRIQPGEVQGCRLVLQLSISDSARKAHWHSLHN